MKKEYLNILILLLIFLVSIYIIRILKITGICFILLSIFSPLFFGFVIAWVLKPIIDKININRVFSTIVIYILFIGIFVFFVIKLFPIIVNEIKNIIPIVKNYIYDHKFLYDLYKNLNISSILNNSFKNINRGISSVFNVGVNIVYSLIFSFYFLIGKGGSNYFNFIPLELRRNISKDLRLYIKSIFLDTLFMFVILSIIFEIIGLDGSLILAFFCAVTNIIPYLGPYIGGVPSVLVGLSTSLNLGIIVLVVIILVQTLENNIVQPFIISKNVELNPIYILIGIILFSHFLGIVGMIISTPIVIIFRNIYLYIKKTKPKWFNLVLDKL